MSTGEEKKEKEKGEGKLVWLTAWKVGPGGLAGLRWRAGLRWPWVALAKGKRRRKVKGVVDGGRWIWWRG